MKLFARTPSAPKVSPPDPTFGDEEAKRLRAELSRGIWDGAQAALEATRGNWNERQFLVDALTDQVPGRPSWTEAWPRARPDSSVAWTVRGYHGVQWAWEARGGGQAESVKDNSWQVFWQRLEEAQRDLVKAAELEPADPVPWAYLITLARGLELGIPEINERLRQAHARHPWHHEAFSQALQGFAEKWGGSHDLMFDLARQVSTNAPDGASAHALICEAHVERWLYMLAFDKDEANARTYFRTPPVGDEIRAAATRSVWSASYEQSRLSPYDHNFFTYCFFRAHDWESARRELQAMNGTLTRYPWALVGKPVDIFNVIQRRILKGE